jgi:hypothetical protein
MLRHIAPKFEGLLKGTKKSIEDIGGDGVGFTRGVKSRFSRSRLILRRARESAQG